MRTPIATKTYYPGTQTILDKQLNEIYEDIRGPGTSPVRIDKTNIATPIELVKAIIVPHAELKYSGPCSAWAYKALAEEGVKTNIYFIIAQAQNSKESGITMETFQMPYGEIRVEQPIVRGLLEKGHIKLNDKLHAEESIIEIQLPFIQHMNKNQLEKIKIVPIFLNSEVDFRELSADIKEVLMEQNKTAAFIFVSNLTAYGRNFHFVPFTEEIPKNIAKIDKSLIDALIKHDEKGFYEAVDKSYVPISGYFALKLLFPLINATKTTLEQNYLSAEINEDYKNCVSYASFVVR